MDKRNAMNYGLRRRQYKECFAWLTMRGSVIFVHALAFIIFIGLVVKSEPILSRTSLSELLFSSVWHPLKGVYGLFPFIISTVEVTAMAMAISIPVCLLCAIYLSEYAGCRFRESV